MTQHLTEDQFISYINHTLTDAEREAMDRHLAGCPGCRTPLADHEALARRVQYDLASNLRAISPSSRMNFRAIAPRMKRSRRVIMFAKQSNQVMTGAVMLVMLVVLGLGLFLLVNNLSQPVAAPQVDLVEPAPAAIEGESQLDSASAQGVATLVMPAQLTFTVFENEPVLASGSYETAAWDKEAAEPGALVLYDDQYHMFYNGNEAFSLGLRHAVGYATSADGVTWTRAVAGPLLTADAVPYAERGIKAKSAFVQDDGTWIIYFSTWNSGSLVSPSDIGRATAPGPEGPWTADDRPVLEPGPAGSWDGYAVADPSIVRTGDGYVMYYTGLDGFFGTRMIGMATSADGLAWTKYDDPTTSEAPFAESDPILMPGEPEAWDSKHVKDPSVQQTPDGWLMVYASNEGSATGGNERIGYAISADGQHWARAGELLQLTEFLDNRYRAAALRYDNGTYYLYLARSRTRFGGQGFDTFLATAGQPIGVPE